MEVAIFGDGVFYDPADKRFKMWYHAGWFTGTSYAINLDGLHWERPSLNVAGRSFHVAMRVLSAHQPEDRWCRTHSQRFSW